MRKLTHNPQSSIHDPLSHDTLLLLLVTHPHALVADPFNMRLAREHPEFQSAVAAIDGTGGA